MKTTSLNKLIKNILLGALTTIMIFSFTACTRKIPFLTSLVVPAAKGYIIVRRDNNKNYVIRIHISNLAEATRPAKNRKYWAVK
jgi:hypothetical protein